MSSKLGVCPGLADSAREKIKIGTCRSLDTPNMVAIVQIGKELIRTGGRSSVRVRERMPFGSSGAESERMITVRRGIICGGISSASERWAPNDAGETSPVKFC